MEQSSVTDSAPRLIPVGECLQRLNISRDTFYKRVKAGEIRLKKWGRRSFMSSRDMAELIDGLPHARVD